MEDDTGRGPQPAEAAPVPAHCELVPEWEAAAPGGVASGAEHYVAAYKRRPKE